MCEIRKILIIKNQGFLFSKSFPLIERKVRKLMKSSKFELPEDSVIVDLINTKEAKKPLEMPTQTHRPEIKLIENERTKNERPSMFKMETYEYFIEDFFLKVNQQLVPMIKVSKLDYHIVMFPVNTELYADLPLEELFDKLITSYQSYVCMQFACQMLEFLKQRSEALKDLLVIKLDALITYFMPYGTILDDSFLESEKYLFEESAEGVAQLTSFVKDPNFCKPTQWRKTVQKPLEELIVYINENISGYQFDHSEVEDIMLLKGEIEIKQKGSCNEEICLNIFKMSPSMLSSLVLDLYGKLSFHQIQNSKTAKLSYFSPNVDRYRLLTYESREIPDLPIKVAFQIKKVQEATFRILLSVMVTDNTYKKLEHFSVHLKTGISFYMVDTDLIASEGMASLKNSSHLVWSFKNFKSLSKEQTLTGCIFTAAAAWPEEMQSQKFDKKPRQPQPIVDEKATLKKNIQFLDTEENFVVVDFEIEDHSLMDLELKKDSISFYPFRSPKINFIRRIKTDTYYVFKLENLEMQKFSHKLLLPYDGEKIIPSEPSLSNVSDI